MYFAVWGKSKITSAKSQKMSLLGQGGVTWSWFKLIEAMSVVLKYFSFFQEFQLCVKEPEKIIAPGLEVNAVIEYYTEKEKDCHDHLVLLVNGITEKVPLYGYVTSSKIITANRLFEILCIFKVLLPGSLIFRDNVWYVV